MISTKLLTDCEETAGENSSVHFVEESEEAHIEHYQSTSEEDCNTRQDGVRNCFLLGYDLMFLQLHFCLG